MKISKIILLHVLIILLITKCDKDDNPYITNDIPTVQYTSYFQGLNDGENKRSINVSWEEYPGSDFTSYIITDGDNNTLQTITSQSTTTATLTNLDNIELDEIKTLKLKLNGSEKGQIQVFTRPVSPASNLTVQGNEVNSKTISWTASADNDISEIILYKTNDSEFAQDRPSIDDNNGTPNSIWTQLQSVANSPFDSHLDNDINSSFNYFYMVKVIDEAGGYRYSYIASNIVGLAEAGSVLGASGGTLNMTFSVSSSEYSDHTSFGWTDYGDNDFYELQVWRSEQSNFDIDNGQGNLVMKTSDQTINSFKDYTIIDGTDYGSGKTWYYKIRVYNIYGNYADSNTITCQTGL